MLIISDLELLTVGNCSANYSVVYSRAFSGFSVAMGVEANKGVWLLIRITGSLLKSKRYSYLSSAYTNIWQKTLLDALMIMLMA